MKTQYVIALILTAAAVKAADVPPLDVRPGMWENTMTLDISGVPPIPPDVLAKMTPAQKAMIEGTLKKQVPHTTTSRHCLKKEDLNKALTFGQEKGSCQRTVSSATSKKQDLEFSCDHNGVKTSGTILIEALDGEHVKVTMRSKTTPASGGNAMTVNAAGQGKWVSDSCEESQK